MLRKSHTTGNACCYKFATVQYHIALVQCRIELFTPLGVQHISPPHKIPPTLLTSVSLPGKQNCGYFQYLPIV